MFLLGLLLNQAIACNELPHKTPTEARANQVTFTIGTPIKYCLTLPQPKKSSLIEFKTVNLGNTSCGSLKMVVISPDKVKYKSTGSQPGVAAFYQPGVWRMKYTLKEGCNLYDLIATW